MMISSSIKPKVLVTRSTYLPAAIGLLQQFFEVDCWDDKKNGPLKKEDFVKLIKDKFGVFTSYGGETPLDKDIINAGAPTLRVVSSCTTGLDHIDLEALRENKVRLGYTPNAYTEATAELAVSLLTATSRRVVEASNMVKGGGWTTNRALLELNGPGLHDSTVGIIGYGKIGHSIAVKLKAFLPKTIMYTSRQEKRNGTSIGAVRTDLENLLRSSDFVILSSALTPETRGILSRSKIALMKNTSILVNVGRGELVEQDALVEALQRKTILAAGLDVMTPEPLPLDHPLLKLDNCVVLPHIGGASIKATQDAHMLAANNIIAVLKGTTMPAEYLFCEKS